MSENNYLYRQRTRSCGAERERLLGRSGDRGTEALRGSREMPRAAAEPAPHARIHRRSPPPARAEAALANWKGSGGGGKYINKKIAGGEGVALSAARTLHHRLLLWEGGRGVDRGRRGAPCSSALSMLSFFFNARTSANAIFIISELQNARSG